MKYISLTQNKFAIVDDEDFDILNQYSWCKTGGTKNYACNCKFGLMHRFIINLHNIFIPRDYEIDHINQNGFDNRKLNLRVCKRYQNRHNSKININNSSGYKGVFYEKRSKLWKSVIIIDNKLINLGIFSSSRLAGIAYQLAAKKFLKDFNCNHIHDVTEEEIRFIDPIINGFKNPQQYDSIYHGVAKTKEGKWRAYYSINSCQKRIGTFSTDIEAAIARDNYCRKNNISIRKFNFQKNV